MADEPLQYNRDIRPILTENCFACHGLDSVAREADLRLDRREDALDFGAIEPGDAESSELIARIDSADAESVMPPPETKKRLTPEQRATLRRWVNEGAAYEKHWSLQPPVKLVLPQVEDAAWGKNEIDRFVLRRLRMAGLTPASEEEPRRLLRRLSLDITGLPPSPAAVETFVDEYAKEGDEALSRWIDRLMSSAAWGEHRGRYWLDAARYGDTHGMHFDNYREMWPYRDWVIRSFNSNQPFDQFTVEQLAGDLLENPSLDQQIATGFQRCAMTTNEGGTIAEENLATYAADRVQTFGWVYLGMTTNCCQCHDHKFDPISTKDYYSLAAFFRNTTQGALDGNSKDGRGPVVRVPQEADASRWAVIDDEIATAKAHRDARRTLAAEAFTQWLDAATAESIRADSPTEGLIAWLPLTEGSGNDISARIAPDDFKSEVTGDLAWADDGQLGPALVLKPGGTLQLGTLGDFPKEQAFSHAEWFRTSNPNQSAGIVARMDEANKHRGWDLFISGGKLSMHLIDSWPDNAIKVSTAQPVVKKDTWQHVCVTWDGSGKPEGIKIFVDGQSQATTIDTNTIAADAEVKTETPLRIGQRSTGSVVDGGGLQDLRIFSRALAADEVQQLASSELIARALAVPAEQRSISDNDTLLEYFLTRHDVDFPRLVAAVVKLEAERAEIEARSPVTHVQVERTDRPAMANILMRGEYDNVGEEVAADTPTALHPFPENAPRNRLGLARWVVDPANPLTARVTVNRFWQEVFGQGIVVTPEDFGVMGSLPTHPELLDWLATDFASNGWDVKRFFKQVLMSATYRQAAVVTPEKIEKDRDNSLLSRGPRFRMDAEMVRDYALSVSGMLSPVMYGPSVRPYQPTDIWNMVGLPGGDTRDYKQDSGDDLYRRSLYTFWKRMAPPPSLDAFNAPSREVCTVRRERTNTPLQALVTLNDPQFVEAARKLAELALREGESEDRAVMDVVSKRVLCRSLTEREIEIAMATHNELRDYYNAHPQDAETLVALGESQVEAAVGQTELAAWTMTCNEILNLDEVLNK